MEFGEPHQARVDALLARVADAVSTTTALPLAERSIHLQELVGLLHQAVSMERHLAQASDGWGAARGEVADAVALLTERIRILAYRG